MVQQVKTQMVQGTKREPMSLGVGGANVSVCDFIAIYSIPSPHLEDKECSYSGILTFHIFARWLPRWRRLNITPFIPNAAAESNTVWISMEKPNSYAICVLARSFYLDSYFVLIAGSSKAPQAIASFISFTILF